jgi:1-phosphofructokinase
MIYTLTLNPSLDYHIWLSDFTEGTIHPVQKDWKDAGGKGINVSKVLQVLGKESVILGFAGGFTGSFIRGQIEQLNIAHRLIEVQGDSRINVKLKAAKESEISGKSPLISQEALSELFAQLEKLSKEDYLVLAGSVPDSLPADIYQTIMKQTRAKGVQIILDAKGKSLRESLKENPFLIKPNHHELGDLFGVSIQSAEEALIYGRKALDLGAQHVMVSMAGKGAVFVSEQESLIAEFPERKPVNSIGAGDSMVAGFLFAYTLFGKKDIAFRYAVAAGTATALSEGFCTKEKIEAFMPYISIKQTV